MEVSTQTRPLEFPLPLRGKWLQRFNAAALWTLLIVALCHCLWLATSLPRLLSARNARYEFRPQWRFNEEFGRPTLQGHPAQLDAGPLRVVYTYPARGKRTRSDSGARPWAWLGAIALPYVLGGLFLRGRRFADFAWCCSGVLIILFLTSATACGPIECRTIGLWTLVVELPNAVFR